MGSLWVRWSLRDLGRRWSLVAAIALVIALGTGTYAALLSTGEWRRSSNDASFAALRTHDLRVRLSAGATVPEGTLARLVRDLPHAPDVVAARERLVVPTQVATQHGTVSSGELVGTATGTTPGGDAGVDEVSVAGGRALGQQDDGAPVVVLERSYAEANDLPTTGHITLSGSSMAEYIGTGQSPESFLVTGNQAALPFMSQKTFAVVFSSLHTAQSLSRAPGRVNDVVLTVRDPASTDTVRGELQSAVAGLRPQVTADVTTRRDIDAYRVLYDDIAGDEKLWRIIALLVLLGAAFAALNLTTRVVEAQRREIGIGMALGVRDRLLAVRPLLFGAEVAFIGVALGVGVGWLVGIPLRNVLIDMIPLPIWRTPFQPSVFAQAATLGFLLPFAAVTWPVWRAVRVQPVEAIRVGHLAAQRSAGPRRAGRIRLPGRSYRQIPVRNLLRTPRRTMLTALGIAAAITTLVTTMGFLDTFGGTLDRSEAEALRVAPDRVTVSLRELKPVDSATVTTVRALPEVASVSTGLLLPVTASAHSSIELVAEVLPADAPWRPALTAGTSTGGLVLARKAADDLGVRIGDSVDVQHPQAVEGGMRTATSSFRVVGLHANPMRMLAYLDTGAAQAFGMQGATNLLTVVPKAGVGPEATRKALLAVPEVAAAEATRTTVEGMRSSLDEFIGILRVAAVITLLLALLIAFNTASIGMDERNREHATMLAFGLPVRTVLGMTTVETTLVGVAGTVLGIVSGYGLLVWISRAVVPTVLPEVSVTAMIGAPTVAAAFVLGIASVAAAPLLTLRRLRRTNIPATLRVVE